MKIKENILTDKLYKDLYIKTINHLAIFYPQQTIPPEDYIIKKVKTYFESVVYNYIKIKYSSISIYTLNVQYQEKLDNEFYNIVNPFLDVIEDSIILQRTVIFYKSEKDNLEKSHRQQTDNTIFEKEKIFPDALAYYNLAQKEKYIDILKEARSYKGALKYACKKYQYSERDGEPLYQSNEKGNFPFENMYSQFKKYYAKINQKKSPHKTNPLNTSKAK